MTTTTASRDVSIAALWMSGALVSFIMMAISGRELAGSISTWQLLSVRSLIGLAILLPIILLTEPKLLKPSNAKLHLLRNSSHFFGQYCWFYAIAFISLADLFAIEFTVPIWSALLAPALLSERLSPVRLLSVLIGFAGILVVLRPGIELISPAALVMLAGALGFSVALLTTKKLTQGNQALTILFYMCLMQLPMGLIPALSDWQPIETWQFPWILLVGITAMTAHYSISRAMSVADATVVIPMDFLRLPLIAVIGYLVYDEAIDIWVLIGALIMLLGNYLNISAEKKRLASALGAK